MRYKATKEVLPCRFKTKVVPHFQTPLELDESAEKIVIFDTKSFFLENFIGTYQKSDLE